MSKNDITGDSLKTKPSSQDYLDGWDRIFNKGNKECTEAEKKATAESAKLESESTYQQE